MNLYKKSEIPEHLRQYFEPAEMGAEETPEEYIANLVAVFEEVRRVTRDDGTLWLNLGDSYAGTGSKGKYTDPKYSEGRNGQEVSITSKLAGYKKKDLIGIPWMAAFALRQAGWYLRQDIIWQKPNVMPSSVKDRCTTSHEYIFLFSKSPKYYYDQHAIMEPCVTYEDRPHGVVREREFGYDSKQAQIREQLGVSKNLQEKGQTTHSFHKRRAEGLPDEVRMMRNKRSVWSVNTKPYKGAHFATFNAELITPCILAGCPEGGIVLDPFMGSGTVGMVANKHGRDYIGVELNPDYIELAKARIAS
jgi:DNA modification methylase